MGKKINLVKKALYIGFGTFVAYTLTEPIISQKINENRFGKQYTSYKQSLDSAFFSDLDEIKATYIMQGNGLNMKSPEFQELKTNYQKEETALTEKWFNDTEDLKASLEK
jgi:hypothetical protein